MRKKREAIGMTQETLAEKAGLHPTYIGMLERRLRNPSLNVMKSLAEALRTPLHRLIEDSESTFSKLKRKGKI